MSGPTPWDPDTEFIIKPSDTPVTVDGYAEGEPKWLICAECGARVKLTEEPSRGIDEPGHRVDCSQRFVHSDWYRDQTCGGCSEP